MDTLLLFFLAAIALVIVVWTIVIVPANNLRRKVNREFRKRMKSTNKAIKKCSLPIDDTNSDPLQEKSGIDSSLKKDSSSIVAKD